MRFAALPQFLGAALDILFPRACEGCGASLAGPPDGRYVCWSCLADVKLIQEPFCALCGQPVFGAIDHAYHCHACHVDPPAFDSARSCALHEGVLREWLMTFKYNQGLWLLDDLATLLEATARNWLSPGESDAVVAVPLHPVKQRDRGFNQSERLARALARRLALPCHSNILKRIRATPTQTKLTTGQRKSNVQGAFVAHWTRWIEGRRFILVDDVMTTGATVSECARVLKAAGALRVDVLTLARGVL